MCREAEAVLVLIAILLIAVFSGASSSSSAKAENPAVGVGLLKKRATTGEYGVQHVLEKMCEDNDGSLNQCLPRIDRAALAFAVTLTDAQRQRLPPPTHDTEGPLTVANGGENGPCNSCPNVTILAYRSLAFKVIGSYLFDSLSLWLLNLAHRVDDTSHVVKLPTGILLNCSASVSTEHERGVAYSMDQEEFAKQLTYLILEQSGMDMDGWVTKTTLHPNSEEETSKTTTNTLNACLLFLTNGLFALFTAYLSASLVLMCLVTKTSVFSSKPFHAELGRVLKRPTVNTLLQGLFATSVMLLYLFIASIVTDAVVFYTYKNRETNEAMNIIFDNEKSWDKVLSPYTIHLVFLGLTIIVSFMLGLTECKEVGLSALKDRIGLAHACSLLSVLVYHSVFVLMAMFIDFTTVVTSLTVFSTVSILLVLSFSSVIQQFRNARGFNCFLFLVAIMDAVIMSLYGIFLSTFSALVKEKDKSESSAQWFCVVLMSSLMAISFCLYIFVLLVRKGFGTRRTCDREATNRRNGVDCSGNYNTPESLRQQHYMDLDVVVVREGDREDSQSTTTVTNTTQRKAAYGDLRRREREMDADTELAGKGNPVCGGGDEMDAMLEEESLLCYHGEGEGKEGNGRERRPNKENRDKSQMAFDEIENEHEGEGGGGGGGGIKKDGVSQIAINFELEEESPVCKLGEEGGEKEEGEEDREGEGEGDRGYGREGGDEGSLNKKEMAVNIELTGEKEKNFKL